MRITQQAQPPPRSSLVFISEDGRLRRSPPLRRPNGMLFRLRLNFFGDQCKERTSLRHNRKFPAGFLFTAVCSQSRMETTSVKKEALFSFGIIADVQYADKEDGDFEGRVQRYKEAPAKLDVAVGAFNSVQSNLLFVLTLGDIIDGNISSEKSLADFEVVLSGLSKLEVPTHHLLGNHCLALPREILLERLCMPAPFYRIDLHPGWALVILDTMDMSVKWPEETANYKEAAAFMQDHPLGEENPQTNVWNGGLGSEHKKWLAHVLSEAARDGTRLIVAAHHPLVAGCAPATHLLWNHEEITQMLVDCPNVELYLNGHYHPGGYAKVGNTHFVTVESILEAPTNSHAHGIVHVFEKEIIIEGSGEVTPRKLQLD